MAKCPRPNRLEMEVNFGRHFSSYGYIKAMRFYAILSNIRRNDVIYWFQEKQ